MGALWDASEWRRFNVNVTVTPQHQGMLLQFSLPNLMFSMTFRCTGPLVSAVLTAEHDAKFVSFKVFLLAVRR